MANSQRVNISKCSKNLIHVSFYINHWNILALLWKVSAHSINSFGNVLQDQIQEKFIFLFTSRVEKGTEKNYKLVNSNPTKNFLQIILFNWKIFNDLLKLYNILMIQLSHNLQFTILKQLDHNYSNTNDKPWIACLAKLFW